MKARVYEVQRFEDGHLKAAQAYDSADVLPLVEAARRFLHDLDGAEKCPVCGEGSGSHIDRPDGSEACPLRALAAALAPFEEEGTK